MAEKWMTICRECGDVCPGRVYPCGKCGSRAIRHVDIGPLFPGEFCSCGGEVDRDYGVFCGKCGAKWNPAVYGRNCPECGELYQK